MIKNNVCGIYKITSPTGKIYIGQSTNIEKRFRYYNSLKTIRQPKLSASFLKHGFENHKKEIIITCQEFELDRLEAFYIKKYNSFESYFGMNLTSGGKNYIVSSDSVYERVKNTKKRVSPNKGKKMSEQQKAIISFKNKNKIISEKTKRLLRIINAGKKHTEESKLKMSKFQKGKFVSEETRLKLRLSNLGKVQESKSHKLNPYLAQLIRRMYSNGSYKQIHLAEIFNISRSAISNVVRKNGRVWKNEI